MSLLMKFVTCTLFGESFTWPFPKYRDLPCEEPIPFQDIEISRDGMVLFIYRYDRGDLRLGTQRNRGEVPNLWEEGWDRLGLPEDATLSGEGAFHAFKLLCAYQMAAPGGDVDQWHGALRAGRVGWRDLECSRPDLVTVPLLSQWKDEQDARQKSANRRGRPVGSRRESVSDELDRHAYEIREDSRRHGRLMSWEKAAQWALKDAPPEVANTVDREAMIARLQKGKAKEKWLNFQATAGKPPQA